jgi:hypothetical protein
MKAAAADRHLTMSEWIRSRLLTAAEDEKR